MGSRLSIFGRAPNKAEDKESSQEVKAEVTPQKQKETTPIDETIAAKDDKQCEEKCRCGDCKCDPCGCAKKEDTPQQPQEKAEPMDQSNDNPPTADAVNDTSDVTQNQETKEPANEVIVSPESHAEEAPKDVQEVQAEVAQELGAEKAQEAQIEVPQESQPEVPQEVSQEVPDVPVEAQPTEAPQEQSQGQEVSQEIPSEGPSQPITEEVKVSSEETREPCLCSPCECNPCKCCGTHEAVQEAAHSEDQPQVTEQMEKLSLEEVKPESESQVGDLKQNVQDVQQEQHPEPEGQSQTPVEEPQSQEQVESEQKPEEKGKDCPPEVVEMPEVPQEASHSTDLQSNDQ